MSLRTDFSLHFHLFFLADPENYNCSVKTDEQWELQKNPSPKVGTWFILLAVVSFTILGSIACGGLITGWLFIRGDIYCTNPFWTYAPGSLGLGCWSASCVLCFALGLSRICAIHRFEWGLLTYVVMAASMGHCFFMMFCTRSVIFNAPRGSWFFSPYIEEDNYANSYHLAENILVTILTPLMYSYVSYKLFYHPAAHAISKSNRRLQTSVCLQSFLVCGLVCIAAVLFAYMQIIDYPPWMPLAAEIAYQICGTLPAAVLLIVNRRIRARAKCILLCINPSSILPASSIKMSGRVSRIHSAIS